MLFRSREGVHGARELMSLRFSHISMRDAISLRTDDDEDSGYRYAVLNRVRQSTVRRTLCVHHMAPATGWLVLTVARWRSVL